MYTDHYLFSLNNIYSHMKRKGVVERIYDESQTQIFSLSSLTPGSRQKFNFSFEINVKTMKGKPTDINEGQQQ